MFKHFYYGTVATVENNLQLIVVSCDSNFSCSKENNWRNKMQNTDVRVVSNLVINIAIKSNI